MNGRKFYTNLFLLCSKSAASLIFIIVFLFKQILFAQPAADDLKKKLLDFSQSNFAEKIYVHTDKSFYVQGEIIWFKVYVVDSRFHTPVDLSKVAYIEILDKNNSPVLQAKTELAKGSGKGSFLIPVSITSGNFRLRAYTRWMRNTDVTYYFEKPLTIINTLKTFTPVSKAPEQYDVGFFPEGGNLVNSLESKVAFKITDQYGKGKNAEGLIINQRYDTIIRFITLHAGIGSFLFTPKKGENYKAIIHKGDSSLVIPLPAAYDSGCVMHLEEAGNQIQISVRTSGSLMNETVYLLSHTRGKINFAEAGQINNKTVTFIIDKSLLPPGITTFTVFNQSKQPVCERLYFKRPAATGIKVTTDKTIYTIRSQVTTDLSTDDHDDSLDLSLSVYRLDSLQSPDPADIVTYLLLVSDLYGYIESPEYYFIQTGDDIDKAMNNLMLVHGWRRFNWEEVLNEKKPAFRFIPEYEGHIITGKIINKKNGQPSENIIGFLSSPGKRFQFTTGLSNAQGLIYFNTKDFIGGEHIIVQTDTRINPDTRIDILSPFSEQYNSRPQPALELDTFVQNSLLNYSINSQVQMDFFKDSLNKFYYPYTDSLLYFGMPDKTYYLDNYTRFSTMEEVLREYVMEVAPRKQNKKFHLYLLQNPHEFFESDPLVLVDGVPYFDMDSVMAIDPFKIRKIDIVGKQFLSGPVSSNGILSYSTYNGDLEGIRLDPNAVVIDYEGLQLQREFYSPKYESPVQRISHIPDFRNTLFWSPEISIKALGKKQISFYTSDLEGKYIIVCQGISTKGNIYTGSAYFEVRK